MTCDATKKHVVIIKLNSIEYRTKKLIQLSLNIEIKFSEFSLDYCRLAILIIFFFLNLILLIFYKNIYK